MSTYFPCGVIWTDEKKLDFAFIEFYHIPASHHYAAEYKTGNACKAFATLIVLERRSSSLS